jgi:hypothetical protein
VRCGPLVDKWLLVETEERVDQVVADLKQREEEIASVERELASGKAGSVATDQIKAETTALDAQVEGEKTDTVAPEDTDGEADADGEAEGEEDDGEDAVGEVDMEDVYTDGQAGPQDMGKPSLLEWNVCELTVSVVCRYRCSCRSCRPTSRDQGGWHRKPYISRGRRRRTRARATAPCRIRGFGPNDSKANFGRGSNNARGGYQNHLGVE